MMGKLLAAQLEQAQLEVGIGIPLLEAPFNQYGFLLMDCWIKGIWEFVSKYDIILTSEDYILPTTSASWQ